MFSVTLIGPDGAGKTTITRRLESSGLLPFRYLYMGVNLSASNAALPTSRLIQYLKRRRKRAAAGGTGGPAARADGAPRRRGRLRAMVRLASRLAEEWYRQLISWWYQRRGHVVLYDRHFVFDFAPEIAAQPTLDHRLHRWLLEHAYPRPDLVIYLDAPGEVLFARKGESTVAELERRRQAFLRQGARIRNFVVVDATRPLEDVYREVAARVVRFAGSRGARVGARVGADGIAARVSEPVSERRS